MDSFFQNLYRYRELDQRGQRENFITEIFAHCLRIDEDFRAEFLNSLAINTLCENFRCKTQHIEKDFGRPDICIELGELETIIFIECKVDSTQGENQLVRYAQSLRTAYPNQKKFLIFLTRWFEEVDIAIPENDPKFICLRWYDIFEMLKTSQNLISKEFAKYLIVQKMSTEISFTPSEVNALKNMKEAVSKMNEFLYHLKDMLSIYTKSKIIQSKKMPFQGEYGITTNIPIGELWLGFFEYEHNDEMQICIDMHIDSESPFIEEIEKLLSESNWQTYDEGEYKVWFKAKGLSFFLSTGTFDSGQAIDFIKQEIEKVKKWL